MKFHKNIFMVWFQGYDNIKRETFKQNIHNWKILNPNWNLKVYSDIELQKECKKISKSCFETYMSFELMHLKIDFGRYVLLYLYGGIYVDVDAFVLRSLDSSKDIIEFISKTQNSLGLSCLNIDIIESFLFIQRSKVINNAIMLAFKRNSILKLMILKIIDNSKYNKAFYSNNFHHIQNKTGPVFVNKFLAKYIDKSEIYSIKIFPCSVFEPCPPFGGAIITDDTICIHQMEMSWISNFTKFLIKFYYYFKPTIFIILPYILYKFFKRLYYSHRCLK